MTVEYLTRAGCHLCDEGRKVVARIARLLRIEVVDVNVDAEPGLAEQFGARVPVLRAAGGRVLAEGRLGAGEVAAALLRVRLGIDGSAPG